VVRCTSRRFCWWPSCPAPSSAPRSTVASGCHQTWSPSWRRCTQCEQSAMTTNHRHLASTFSTFFTEASSVVELPWDARQRRSCTSKFVKKEAQLSPRDGEMRRVNWNLANCHATVQKLLIRQVLTKSKCPRTVGGTLQERLFTTKIWQHAVD